jgi:hypothetical protein
VSLVGWLSVAGQRVEKEIESFGEIANDFDLFGGEEGAVFTVDYLFPDGYGCFFQLVML